MTPKPGAPARLFLPMVRTVFYFVCFYFFGGGGLYNGKVIIFVSFFYKVNLEKRLEHFCSLNVRFFFSFLK